MTANTRIEWADHTWNPWVGCTKVSAACDHCYAEGWAKRTGQPHLWTGERRRTSAANWQQPLRWERGAAAFAEQHGRRQRVFCASLADVFDNQAERRWRDDLWHRIKQTPNLDWLLLTKRPQNIVKMLPTREIGAPAWGDGWPNVWLGTTVENQDEADRRIPHLLGVPAAVHWLSCEPLLGPLKLTEIAVPDDWAGKYAGHGYRFNALQREDDLKLFNAPNHVGLVIAGGETGPGARPMHPDWARSLRDQCAAAGTAFFFKQWGEWAPGKCAQAAPTRTAQVAWWIDDHWVLSPRVSEAMHFDDAPDVYRVGRGRSGRLLDGVEHEGMARSGSAANGGRPRASGDPGLDPRLRGDERSGEDRP